MLESEKNWEVCGEACDGQEVVEKAIALSPDLIILDINMPVLNGVAAVRTDIRRTARKRGSWFSVFTNRIRPFARFFRLARMDIYPRAKAGEELVQVVKLLLSGKTFYPEKAAAN